MSIEIKIVLPDNDVGPAALEVHMAALGFTRQAAAVQGVIVRGEPNVQPAAEQPEPTPAPVEAKATRGRKAKETAPAISATPEDRRPPEDDAATQAQDTADEQAEVEAAREPAKPITVDDLRGAMGAYVAAHGMPATQEDGPSIFGDVLGAPPKGEAAWKLSLLADLPQEKLAAAHKAWTDAAAGSARYKKQG